MMKCEKFLAVLGLLICFTIPMKLSAQTTIKGKVIDGDTGRPMPSANIVIKGTTYGTASNRDGFFTIKTNSLPCKLLISYLGYENAEIRITEEGQKKDLVFALQPSVITSKTVTVTDDFEINLVEKAIDKLLSLDQKKIFGKVFYRQLTQSDSIYTEFIETFYNTQLTPNVITDTKVENGRYAVIPYDSLKFTIHHTNFSDFSRVELVDERPFRSSVVWPLRKDSRKNYNFYLQKRYGTTAEEVLVIDFEPKNDIKQPAFTGSVTIGASSYSILKLEARLKDESFNPVNPKAKKTEIQNSTLAFKFSRDSLSDSTFYPNMIQVDLSYDYIKKKGLFGKIDFKRKVHARSVLFFYDYRVNGLPSNLEANYFADDNGDASDYRLIDKADYDPKFWKNNPIIQRTFLEKEIIESFEKYGSFGKMFNPQSSGN